MILTLDQLEKSNFWHITPTINKLCKPLFDKFHITYFDYARFYPDNTCFFFSSDRDYIRYFLDNADYRTPPSVVNSGRHLWTSYIDNNFLESVTNSFPYYHGLTTIRNQPEYIELFNFSAPKNHQQILSIYLNEKAILEYFVVHILTQLETFIKKNKYNRIRLPTQFQQVQPVINTKKLSNELFKTLKDLHKIRKGSTQIELDNHFISVTKRELECMYHISKGSNNKVIAKEMNISHRTVEKYIEKILNKVKLNNRHELIMKIGQHFMLNYAVID